MLPKAATVLLLRQGKDEGEGGFEIFMVKRPAEAAGFSGALVFPGGRLDAADARVGALAARCCRPEGISDDDMAYRICAIRETFEEAGILLARPRGSDALLSGEQAHAVARTYRKRLHAGEIGVGEIAEVEDLIIACDHLTPFAHWITPKGRPRRFDTWFYLAPAPQNQIAAHDDIELVDSTWASPAQAIAEADAGLWRLVFVTRMNLLKLADARSVDEAIARARASEIVAIEPTIEPVAGGGAIFRISPNMGYSLLERFEPAARNE